MQSDTNVNEIVVKITRHEKPQGIREVWNGTIEVDGREVHSGWYVDRPTAVRCTILRLEIGNYHLY